MLVRKSARPTRAAARERGDKTFQHDGCYFYKNIPLWSGPNETGTACKVNVYITAIQFHGRLESAQGPEKKALFH